MTRDLQHLSNTELKHYLSVHRNDEAAFSHALQELLRRRDPHASYHPYPFDLAEPESEVRSLFEEKLHDAAE